MVNITQGDYLWKSVQKNLW